jgi:hypothetical protein
MSLRLQAAFGLRRGESIKIRPEWADRGDQLALKDTWTKGGRAREIPIRNDEQRLVLDEAKALAGRGSLIPADRSYVEQLRRFEHQCAAAGVHRIHGHRHQYAQVRYRELTGWAAPADGGPRSKDMTPEQRELDREARLTISAELGHEREQITAVLDEDRSSDRGVVLHHSTFHHFANFNLDVTHGCPSFVIDPPSSQIQDAPALLNDLKAYVSSVVGYLIDQSAKTERP